MSNSAAAVATRYLTVTERSMTDSAAKLASGTRVVSARDDAASLAIGSRMGAEVSALGQSQVNMRQATSMLQIADGAAAKVNEVLTRMKVLAVQAGSGHLSSVERSMVDTEFQSLKSEIDRIAIATQFNGKGLIDDSGVVLTLRQATQYGTLTLNGKTIGLNDTFSLADVQNGRVKYQNSGSGSSDRLVVGVSRTDGTALGKVVGETSASAFETAEYLASGGLDNIHASTAYARGGSGAGITVAVIDTGIDFYHTDLDGQVVGGVDITDNVLEGNATTAGTTSGDGNDMNGHGTHVAGIIAGERNGQGTMGVAYGASLLAIKASQGATGSFGSNDVADAIDYARLNGAKVINMSISFGGWGWPNPVSAAISRAVNAGMVVVAAAGNSSLDNPDFPASFSIDPAAKGAVIAVEASDDSNNLAGFSNEAGVAKIYTITAPGVNIRSDAANKGTTVTSGTLLSSGTSMASPHVAGAAALLMQMYGAGTASNLSGSDIANLILHTGTDLGDPGVDTTYGEGLLNLDKATVPQLALSINITSSSAVTNSGVLNVVSGQSAALGIDSFSVASGYADMSNGATSSLSFKVGSGTAASDDLSVDFQSLSTLALDISQTSVTTLANANDASTRISAAISRVATARSSLGASQNRIEFASDNLSTTIANVEHARSGLMDLDMAAEITHFTASKLLSDIGVSALAQANARVQSLMRLFN